MENVVVRNPDDRIFQAYGSVEVIDRAGEVIPIEELKSVMPLIMKRGGNLQYNHSNKKIGQILNYEWVNKNVDGTDYPAVLLTCQVYKDYELDDYIWNQIKTGESEGVSFGGRQYQLDVEYKNIAGQPAEILRALEGYEFSVVDRTGNQEATYTFINGLAKGMPQNLIQKLAKELTKAMSLFNNENAHTMGMPFAGYQDFNDCVSQNSDKSDPKAYCATIMNQENKGDNMSENKDSIVKEEAKPAPEAEPKPTPAIPAPSPEAEASKPNVGNTGNPTMGTKPDATKAVDTETPAEDKKPGDSAEDDTKKAEEDNSPKKKPAESTTELQKRFDAIDKRFEAMENTIKSLPEEIAKSLNPVEKGDVTKNAKPAIPSTPTPRPQVLDVEKDDESIGYKVAVGKLKVPANTSVNKFMDENQKNKRGIPGA